MPCTPVNLGDGISAIVCTRGGRRAEPCEEIGCTAPHVALCDYRLASGKTCDRRMCARHRHPVGPNRDYCGPHHRHPEPPAPPAERRIPLAGARKLAEAVVEALRPGCERIEIAGSVRRERPDVGDIEIVAVPRMTPGPRRDMFAWGLGAAAAADAISKETQRLGLDSRALILRSTPHMDCDCIECRPHTY